MKNRTIFLGGLFGFIYGFILLVLAMFCTGWGHGTYTPILISSSPLGLAGVLARPEEEEAMIAALGIPIFWMCVGFFCASSAKPSSQSRVLFRVFMELHYVVGFVLFFFFNPEYGDWRELQKTWKYDPDLIIRWLIVYILGQIIVWTLFFRFVKRGNIQQNPVVDAAKPSQ